MNFVVDRNGIADALAVTTRAINSKSSLPILGNVLVSAEIDGGVRITATNLQMSIECDLPATYITANGAVTVSGKVLQKIVKGLPKQKMSFAAITKTTETTGSDGNPKKEVDCRVMLECSGTKFTLQGISADEFPTVLRPTKDVCTFSIAQRELLKLIAATKFSIGWDETRPTLTTARLSFESGQLQLVTTDTHRLTVHRGPLLGEVTGYDDKQPPLVPGKALAEVERLLSAQSEDAVNVSFDSQTMRFQIGNIALTTHLEQGMFPNYRHVIPIGHTWGMAANRRGLIEGIKRVFIVAQDGNDYLMLRAYPNAEEADGTFSSGDLRIVAYSALLGKAEHVMTASVTGNPVATAINVNYLLDALEAMKSKTVIFDMGENPLSPVKILETDPEEQNFLHIVMPLKIAETLAPEFT